MANEKKDSFNSIVNSIKKSSDSSTGNNSISSRINSSNKSGLQVLNESGLRRTDYSLKNGKREKE